MITPETFRHSQWAIERSAMNSQQSLVLHESAKEIISESWRLVQAMRNPRPIYKAPAQ